MPLLRSFVKKLNYLTMTRGDFIKSAEEMKRVSRTLKQGVSLIVYPEGTFTFSKGVHPFKLGAFTVAMENHVPVCPIALKGVRNILRGTDLLLSRGKVTVTIRKPMNTGEERWARVTTIREKARSIIAKYNSGEEKL